MTLFLLTLRTHIANGFRFSTDNLQNTCSKDKENQKIQNKKMRFEMCNMRFETSYEM